MLGHLNRQVQLCPQKQLNHNNTFGCCKHLDLYQKYWGLWDPSFGPVWLKYSQWSKVIFDHPYFFKGLGEFQIMKHGKWVFHVWHIWAFVNKDVIEEGIVSSVTAAGFNVFLINILLTFPWTNPHKLSWLDRKLFRIRNTFVTFLALY